LAPQPEEDEAPGGLRNRANSCRRLRRIAAGSAAVGIAPLVANCLSDAVARALGCYIAEYSIYDRSGTWSDFSDDVVGCRLGGIDIGSLLVAAHSAGLAIVVTWPLILLSVWLWVSLLLRRSSRH